jgi:hypothetical protein
MLMLDIINILTMTIISGNTNFVRMRQTLFMFHSYHDRHFEIMASNCLLNAFVSNLLLPISPSHMFWCST